ncbi:tetratricopeptide repeat protein [Roseiconus lacunae]|uniref:hypothetical protein n=1 Tax=Roseiconus lacunae TaxID=2605694 RepID=UPI001E63D0F4|nr:hypothetical protein [Roseiconus lacunae]MCD0462265.1 hypothetical protein [Roseiconus lacunae]
MMANRNADCASRKLTVSTFVFCLWLLSFLGCSNFRSGTWISKEYTTYSPADIEQNDKAHRLNGKGLLALKRGDFQKAEQLFRESLQLDVSFGPAHNNLGQIYLAKHQLYLAAWEFEYAANLMPDLVEPIINQGLAYETAEQFEKAEAYYRRAYNQNPHNAVAIGSLLRALIKQDRASVEIGLLLDELILHDHRANWITWAKQLRSTKYRDPFNSCSTCENTLEPEQFFSPLQFPEHSEGLDIFNKDSQSLELLPPQQTENALNVAPEGLDTDCSFPNLLSQPLDISFDPVFGEVIQTAYQGPAANSNAPPSFEGAGSGSAEIDKLGGLRIGDDVSFNSIANKIEESLK